MAAKNETPQCKNCGYAEWQRTPTGRIKNAAGACDWMTVDAPLPASVKEVSITRFAIWPGDGKNCPTWQPA